MASGWARSWLLELGHGPAQVERGAGLDVDLGPPPLDQAVPARPDPTCPTRPDRPSPPAAEVGIDELEQGQLDRRRAGVHRQHVAQGRARRPGHPGQVQSRISGMSSKCSRT